MKEYTILLKAFSGSIETIHMPFVLGSVYEMFYVYWFADAIPFLDTWNETHLTMVYDIFNALLDSVIKYFTEDFCVCVH
jgi:hypothetical protein